MLEAHRGEKVDGRSTWGRAVKAERKREAALEEVRASLKQKTDRLPEETRLRATYLAPEGKTLTITVHQGKNYVEISNVTLVEISE
jgi:ribosomal protein S19